MPDSEDIDAQCKILEANRRTLALYLVQYAAQGGVAYVQPSVVNGIAETRSQIRRCKQTLRDWGAAFEEYPDDEPTASETASSKALAQPSPSKRAGAGLDALADLMRAVDARDAVASYQAYFHVACRQIEVLSLYKQLHDLFQQLDDRYVIIARFSKGLPLNMTAWDDVERDEPDLYLTAEALLGLAASAALAGEAALWAQKLGRAQRDLRAALESYDAEQLRDGLGRLKDVVDRQISRTNTRLVGAAKALDLAKLVAALRTICEQLSQLTMGGGATHQLDDFRIGVEALAELNRRLMTAVDLHAAFQDIDDELRLLEGLLEVEPGSLAGAWQDVGPLMRAICEHNPIDWATKLTALGADLEAALQLTDQNRVRRCFVRYRSQSVQSFNQIDHDLLALCTELQQVGAPLDRVLRIIE